MVARIVHGKSVRGILNYNENKLKDDEAKLLLASGYPVAPDQLTFRQKLHFFEALTCQNKMTATNAMHITLNFSPEDLLDEMKLKAIALDYMDQIGFGGQPFLVYQHFDAAHPHIHLVTVNIEEGGARIETHNIGKTVSEKARKDIEQRYNLIRAEDQVTQMSYMLRPVELEKIIYGKSQTKAAISAIVREVSSSYKFGSLPEFNAALGQFNVMAYPGAPGSVMNEKGGLVYFLMDEERQPVGIPIKASSIFSSPTLKNLEKKFVPNRESRKPYGQRLRHLLDKAIDGSKSREELEAQLRSHGIRMLVRENAQGQIYGLTFIDNATRAVFNGSDLGKAYSAKSFLERVPAPAESLEADHSLLPAKTFPASQTTGSSLADLQSPIKSYPAQDQPVILSLIDAIMSDEHEENTPDPYRRKKRKRIQTE